MRSLVLTFLILVFSGCGTRDHIDYYSENGQNVAGPPVSRTLVILTADTYARVNWFMAEINQRGTSCNGNFTSDYPIGPRTGMGYKFGGWDTVSTFLSKVAAGYGTGTGPETYKNYPFECVTGISCTGLISRAWHLNQKYTLTYPDQPDVPRQFHEITKKVCDIRFLYHQYSNLKKGDAFINRTHIMLFMYENKDGSPMVMDSSVKGVRFRKKSWFELWVSGYLPIRYNNIRDDINPLGTINNPIVIDSESFPFIHDGNTRNVVSMEFDRYSAAPAVNQQGPEVIYKLKMKSSAKVSIQITDFNNEGIDNDIHLLSSLEKGAEFEALDCFAIGDRKINIQLNAGDYYLIVDSRRDQPGNYKLRIKEIG